MLEDFEQLQSRLEELKTQVVSSPEELKEVCIIRIINDIWYELIIETRFS